MRRKYARRGAPLLERLYHHLPHRPDVGCWEWVGFRHPDGYGRLKYQGRMWLTHRAMYEAVHGPIPPGGVICHRCDNRACCNPDHLFLGSPRDNFLDMVEKGRHAHTAAPALSAYRTQSWTFTSL
ncbi:MAG: HNH endonuclease signature motif containing protein [Cyanobium sp.]|nr:HNH endonuclease signature motif containing protein [Cyanobium sp.]